MPKREIISNMLGYQLVTTAVLKPQVTRPRPKKPNATKPHSPPRRHINRSPSPKAINFPPNVTTVKVSQGNPEHALKDKGVIDSGCSQNMTGNMSYLSDFEAINGGYVTFGGNPKGGKISRKGKIRIGKLDFDDVYFVKELKFNHFIISQMCDKKNSVLFTDIECLVLSPEFKLPDENQVLLRAPRENNMYNVNLKNIIPSEDLTCLFAKATLDEMKGIKKEFSIPKTPQQNGIDERKNRTLIEAAGTMLADSLLPTPFWAEAVNTAYSLGKFDGKVDEGFLIGYPNTDVDVAFEVKEPEFKGRKPQPEVYVSPSSSAQSKKHDDKTKIEAKGKSLVESLTRYRNLSAEFEDFFDNSINEVNAADSPFLLPTHGKSSYVDSSQLLDDPNIPELEDITYSDDKYDVGAEADFNNLETSITISLIPTTRVHKDHHVTQIISDLSSATQTRSMTRVVKDQGGLSQINNDDFHTCMFACFLSQEEPKRLHEALKDPSWIEAMQEEQLQFKMQKVWVLVDLPHEKRAIGHTQEEGINHEEVFAPVSRIEAISMFLAYASFMGFMVYQMDIKSAFLYGTIEEEVYVCQPRGFKDPDYPDKVNKVVKTLYGLHQAPRAWYETLANYLLENGFQRGKINQTLFIKRQKDGKSASTPIDSEKPLLKDPDGEDVDVHTYKSMIGLLMYLTSSRPDIMFAVCACARFQVTPKSLHLHAVKRIFRYLKGKPHLGLWYPKDSPFNLVSYSDSDYTGASLDKKSTTGGC
nr:hypothetical protein [Tanacetum cinerariifolium]